MPARLTPVVEEMLLRLAPEMPFVARLPLANLWAFRPLMVPALQQSPQLNAAAADNYRRHHGQRQPEGKRSANCGQGAR